LLQEMKLLSVTTTFSGITSRSGLESGLGSIFPNPNVPGGQAAQSSSAVGVKLLGKCNLAMTKAWSPSCQSEPEQRTCLSNQSSVAAYPAQHASSQSAAPASSWYIRAAMHQLPPTEAL
jgi:hypothetical protein